MAITNKTQAPANTGGISLAPSTFVQGGGLLDDADVEITDAAFCMWDYNGNVKPEVPALGLQLRRLEDGNWVPDPKNKESGYEDNDQYWSAGSAEYFVPNDSGGGLKTVGDKTSIVNSTNAALLIASMVNCGVPESLFASGNIKDLIGLRMHVNRMEQPKKGGNKAGFTGDPNKKSEVLVCTKLISLPGQQPAQTATVSKTAQKVNGKPAQAAATTAKPAAAAETPAPASGGFDPNNDAHVEAMSKVLEVLSNAEGGTILRKNLAPAVFKLYEKGDKTAPVSMKLAFDEGFLKGGQEAGMGWQYDGTTVSIG